MQKMKTKAFWRQDVGETGTWRAQRADLQQERGYGSPAAQGAEQESSRDALLWAGTGRLIGWGEGEERGALCSGRRWLFWVRRMKLQAAGWRKNPKM